MWLKLPWFTTLLIILLTLGLELFSFITFLPYFIMAPIGRGKWFKQKHYILVENLHQFIIQPKNYVKKRKNIHQNIVNNAKELF